MDNFWKENCRLCLDTITSEGFEKISNVTNEILDILLLKLDVDKSKHVMCKVCALKVREALKFKSMCINTDNLIISYVDDETGSSVDLLRIYAEKKGNKQLINTLHDHKVCRLCMQLIQGEFILVHEIKLDAIEKYIPEVNISVIEDPVVCKQCFDSVDTHSSFLKNCSEVEEKIKGCCDYTSFNSSSRASESELPTETEESIIKQENNETNDECIESKFTLEAVKEDNEYEIKIECIDLKWEEDDERGTIPISSHAPLMSRHEEHAYARSFEGDRLKRKEQMYKCDKCDYETNDLWYIKRHHSSHTDLPKEEMYQCDKCSFASKYKDNLKQHQVVHEDRMYKCDKCSYASKHGKLLKRHQLLHKDPSQIQVYKCDECGYKSRYKDNVKKHQLKHKDPSQVPMYKCDKCSFETMYRNNLKRHQLRHKDPS